ncbi:DUF952 domain-containing protein [Merismopedia glauca]|uniref:DUF952 domain-containing protein n=1 Tax=Merismopedia glauca CCAP 1448/3 TaxID=1296344 RepID=A0A2T1C918_9CYAN|nr:DUF952 domain-containing protein [Merismopedia glauca]PSB04633.1 DUF952 domain-containing protein [Merismopedia glauca CCAP 1448/3]
MIYRITNNYDWDLAQKNGYFVSADLNLEGFIHCSSIDQVVEVANRLYKGQTNLLLLEIEETRLSATLKWEDTHGSGELFPHVYGTIALDAIARCLNFQPNVAGL